MSLKVCAILAALFSEVVAFRMRPKRRAKPRGVAGAGTSLSSSTSGDLVDQLFIFGAPGVSDSALTTKNGGCIAGMRVYSSHKTAFGTMRLLDWPTLIVQPLGFKANKMDSIMFDTKDNEVRAGDCPDTVRQNKPTLMSFGIHDVDIYLENGHKVANVVPYEVIDVAMRYSYERDLDAAKKAVEAKGWDMLGSALVGGSSEGGPQAAHLMQNRSSGSCMLTFQGSDSVEDMWATLDASKVPFCGLSGRVHKGWRDNMLRMTTSSGWQANIRTKLPSCSKVVVVGHSMGGGMASLFTSCMLNGESDDFEKMNW